MLDRKIKPTTEKTIKFDPPSLSVFSLSNGLSVYFVQKNELPIIRINLLLYSGSRVDPEKLKGLANLTSMCIDEGAGGMTAVELADEFEMLGTHISVGADDDIIQLSMQVLSGNFEPAFSLFSKVLLTPNLFEKEYDQEKRKLITTLLQLKDDPDYLADTSFEHIIFGNTNPYANPTLGTKETINNISLENLKAFYKNNFSPKNSSLIVVGNINESELKSKLENQLGAWKTKYDNLVFNDVKTTLNKDIIIVNKPGSVQTEIRIGYVIGRRNKENYFQRLLLNTILGGQFSSRINLNLREKHGYTYGAHSRIGYYQHSGFFQVSTSVGIENSVKALEQIFIELNEIRNGVSKVEVDFAKDTITKRFPLGFETYGQISQNIKTLLLHKLDYSYLDEYISRIKEVERNKINNEATVCIKPDEMAVVLVCDKTRINNNELEKFNREIKELEFDDLFNS